MATTWAWAVTDRQPGVYCGRLMQWFRWIVVSTPAG